MENNIKEIIGNTDIYLLDQILKSRYKKGEKILDVGCGTGRNIHWFYQNNYDIYGVDKDMKALLNAKNLYPNIASKISCSEIENLPFKDEYFNHVICNAVLHFAENTKHFLTIFSEIIRELKVKGSIFIRTTSTFGIEDKIKFLSGGVYVLPDTSHRFLFTKAILKEIMTTHQLTFLEPLRTVNVNDIRCMTTLVLQKQ
jgi:ubiquinone/menaquinone biosynthesis C-methylase UbiE